MTKRPTATILPFPGPKRPASLPENPPCPRGWRSLIGVTLYHMDGREWRGAGFYSPVEAWNCVVESVALEYGCDVEEVGVQEDFGGDIVTYDGFPLYRL